MNLSASERYILLIALGLHFSEKPARNWFLTGGTTDPRDRICAGMVDRGLLTEGDNRGKFNLFHATAEGAGAVGHTLPKEA